VFAGCTVAAKTAMYRGPRQTQMKAREIIFIF